MRIIIPFLAFLLVDIVCWNKEQQWNHYEEGGDYFRAIIWEVHDNVCFRSYTIRNIKSNIITKMNKNKYFHRRANRNKEGEPKTAWLSNFMDKNDINDVRAQQLSKIGAFFCRKNSDILLELSQAWTWKCNKHFLRFSYNTYSSYFRYFSTTSSSLIIVICEQHDKMIQEKTMISNIFSSCVPGFK